MTAPAVTSAVQLELPDILGGEPVKNDRALMEFPFFCLTKTPRRTLLSYSDGANTIEIKPGAAGMATIWDKDILIYAASLLNKRLERGAPVDRHISFRAYDVLRVCQRGTGKRSYDLLLAALERLRATTIVTTIKAAGQAERGGFGWIDNYRVLQIAGPGGKMRMEQIDISINEWLFRAIVRERRVLTIDPHYFRLTMGLERRLYDLARKHCGANAAWDISWPQVRKVARKP